MLKCSIFSVQISEILVKSVNSISNQSNPLKIPELHLKIHENHIKFHHCCRVTSLFHGIWRVVKGPGKTTTWSNVASAKQLPREAPAEAEPYLTQVWDARRRSFIWLMMINSA